VSQLHRRLADEQVRTLLHSYCAARIRRADIEDASGVGRSRASAAGWTPAWFPPFLHRPKDSGAAFQTRATPARLPAGALRHKLSLGSALD
jgi:hypothetical protein